LRLPWRQPNQATRNARMLFHKEDDGSTLESEIHVYFRSEAR
jgi:hypothetical protein